MQLRILLFAATILLTGSLISSCGGNESQTTEEEKSQEAWRSLEAEVMEIHDEVMPRMGEMNNLRKKLEEASVNIELTREERQALQDGAQNIVIADSLMWAWMYDYKRPSNEDEAEIIEYLESEKKKVEGVRDAMLEAIAEGDELLNKYGSADEE